MTTRRKKIEPGEVQVSGESANGVRVGGDPEPVAAEVSPALDKNRNGAVDDFLGTATKPVAEYDRKWNGIVESVVDVGDPTEQVKRLRAELTLAPEALHGSYASIVEALDQSASNLELASRLARAAKLEETHYTSIVDQRLEVMRSTVVNDLNEEYRKKLRSSPTNADIEGRMIANWPAEYTGIKNRLAEIHAAVRVLEGLREAWMSRGPDLRIMADKARSDQL